MLEKGASIDIVAQFDDADSLFREKYIKSEQKHRYEIKKCYFILHCNLLERTVEGGITIIFCNDNREFDESRIFIISIARLHLFL